MAHIVGDRKGEIPTAAEVRVAVEDPDRVTRDVDFSQRECFYRTWLPGRLMLMVVVHYRPVPPQGTWLGSVITAYSVGLVKRQEVQRWP